MMKLNKPLLIAFGILCCMSMALGQNDKPKTKTTKAPAGSVSGIVVDSESEEVLEYATVAVYRAKDSSLVSGLMTNETGRFSFTNISAGAYFLRVDYIGYKRADIAFALTAENPSKRFGKVKVVNNSKMLDAVTVEGKREMISSNLDKKVFNVEQNIVTAGGSALDVMENVPSVEVDLDGNVSLRGSTNVTVLIDGRPSTMELEQIPAESIESVEVVTNPSARYEPDGTSGIINVILKKKKEAGFNGMITMNGGAGLYRDSLHFNHAGVAANLNFSYNKLNFFLNINHRWHERKGSGISRSIQNDTLNREQSNANVHDGRFTNARLGVDFFINKKNTLSVSGMAGFRPSSNERDVLSHSFISLPTDSVYDLQRYFKHNNTPREGRNYEVAANYKRTYATKGKELTADAFFSASDNDNSSREVQTYSFPTTLSEYQRTSTVQSNRNATLQTDFVSPIGNGGRFEAGAKQTMKFIDYDYRLRAGGSEDNLVEDPNKCNHFLYDEYITAAYAIYSNSLLSEKFIYQLGLRSEYTYTSSEQRTTNSKQTRSYIDFFPTVHLKYEWSQFMSSQLSYSRRVSRPNIWVLNPFVDYSDPQNIRFGNPDLKPEFVNSVELGQSFYGKSTTVTASIYYRYRDDIISTLQTIKNGDTLQTTYANLRSSDAFGFETMLSQKILSWWKITGTFNLFHTEINDDQLQTNITKNTSWNTRITNAFPITKSFDMQLVFFYRAPTLTAGGGMRGGAGQGKSREMYFFDFGAKLRMLENNRMTISFNIRDIFRTMKFKNETYAENLYNFSKNDREAPTFMLSVSYRFNDYKAKKRNLGSGDDDDDDD